MKPRPIVHDVPSLAASLPTLELAARPTYAEAMASAPLLAAFQGCEVRVARFAGEPPWERHPEDELLYVLDGRLELTLLADVETRVELTAGKLLVVPAGTWHRSNASPRVTVLAATPAEGNERSDAEDPRSRAERLE